MGKAQKKPLFIKGVWIKEQQGRLTIGSLDETDKSVMVIPDKLSSTILEFENDMIEALYGENREAFNPAVIDIEKLLTHIGEKYKKNNLRISFSGTKDNVFKGDYNSILNLIEKFVLSSLPDNSQTDQIPLIYINASVLQGHLCIIYRDSDSISNPSTLINEIGFIKTSLKGEVRYKAKSGNKSYYDIMIPSKE